MTSTMPKPASSSGKAPFRPIVYAEPKVVREDRTDGSILLRSEHALKPYKPSLVALFRSAVQRRPDRLFIAERDASGAWAGLTYPQARKKVDAVAQALLDRGLSPERPVMALSGNAVEHAVLMLACYTAGIPIAPISVAYSLQSQDHAKLKYINELLTPGLVYVSDTGPFAKALAHITAPVIAGRNSANLPGVTLFADLEKTAPSSAVEKSAASINADTIAKFLFTSGSTSLPKGVINTHGMLTANQQQSVQTWPFMEQEDVVLVDWLPWNHTFGSNYTFNLVMQQAGTLYIDGGKPLPALMARPCKICAMWRQPSISTCRQDMARCCPISKATRRWRAISFRNCV